MAVNEHSADTAHSEADLEQAINIRPSTKRTPMDIHARADVAVQQAYTGLDRLPIGGEWRSGKMHALKSYDPYTNEVILEIPQADRSDLDDAYAAAARAQDAWGSDLPSRRGEVLRRAADIMEMRRDEVVSWLICESGSTRLKVNPEWASSHAILLWAASAAQLVNGRRLPTDIRGEFGSSQASRCGGSYQSMELAPAPLDPRDQPLEAFTTDQWATVQQSPRRYPWTAHEVQRPWS
jgi:hypothetical protein